MSDLGILDTIGIEFETDQVFRSILANKLSEIAGIRRPQVLNNYTLHNDASAQIPVYLTGHNYFTIFRDRGVFLSSVFKGRETAGIEFVTNPLQFDELVETISIVTDALKLCGEFETSPRSSIHVHVGFYPRKNWIYNLLFLSLYAEALLFRISGLGYKFRGETNGAVYCRPLNNPPIIRFKDGYYYKMFDATEFCKNIGKKSIDDFWALFLSNGNVGSLGSYPPGRYLSINFLSLLIRRTIEFRTGNISLNANYIQAYVRLCQVITELAIHTKEDELKFLLDNLVDVTKDYSDSDILSILYRINEMSELHNTESKLSQSQMETLIRLVNITPKPYIAPNILSHRCEQGFVSTCDYLGFNVKRDRVLEENVRNSGFIDIHNNVVKSLEFNRIIGEMSN